MRESHIVAVLVHELLRSVVDIVLDVRQAVGIRSKNRQLNDFYHGCPLFAAVVVEVVEVVEVVVEVVVELAAVTAVAAVVAVAAGLVELTNQTLRPTHHYI